MSALALAIGPLVGGLITQHLDWSWIFFVNVPVGVLGIAASYLLIRESKDETHESLDLPGLATSALGLFALVAIIPQSALTYVARTRPVALLDPLTATSIGVGEPKLMTSLTMSAIASRLRDYNFEVLEKDAVIYPAFGPKVAQDAKEQTLRTITELLLKRNTPAARQRAATLVREAIRLRQEGMDELEALHTEGIQYVLSVPFGFVSEHLEVLARRFSDDPSNGFVLMGRYERSMQNGLLRMIRQFHSLQKSHPTTPHAEGERLVPSGFEAERAS